jgi:hypothetical protein
MDPKKWPYIYGHSTNPVKNMTYPVVAQSEVEDIETDTREDLILMHEHNNNEHSNTNNRIQEV